jgi:hypothetical protein
MNFKNILTESLIDTLPMNKVDKVILKHYHNNPGEPNDKDFLDISSKYAISLDDVVSLYETYMKYRDFLFSEEGINKVTEYDVSKYSELTHRVILTYIDKNLKGQEIININGVRGTLEFMDDLKTMISEEMGPEIWLHKSLTGSYTGKINYGDKKGEDYTTDDVDINIALYLSLQLGNRGYGFELINHNHESMGDWMMKYEGKKHSDMMLSGYVKPNFLPPLKNFKEEEVKRFVEQWVNICGKIIRKGAPMIEKYEDFIEHGDSMFSESYNKKRK